MLYESDVIDAVCIRLEAHGYRIRQRLETTQHGDDIIAIKQTPMPCELYIEAKGETSSRQNSQRYGQPFDSAQIRIHVAEAFYKAAEVLSRNYGNAGIRAGIALPDNNGHRTVVKGIEPIVKQLGIAVFWVRENKDVEIASDWSL
jgi:hypothetical protein